MAIGVLQEAVIPRSLISAPLTERKSGICVKSDTTFDRIRRKSLYAGELNLEIRCKKNRLAGREAG